MSITISTPNQICNNALNTSLSKSLYSFPKTERFKDEYKKNLCDQFYQTKTSLSNRKTGFGYGVKSDFTSGKFKTPAPNNYNIKTHIDVKIQNKGGWSFGESRGKMGTNGIFSKHLHGNPGYFFLLRPG